MIEPYIGITGFMSRQEVETILEAFPKNPIRKLMVGVLASSKTLGGRPNKYPERYPAIERINSIFTDDPRVINLIHYSTDSPDDLHRQLTKLIKIAGPNLHGFQLNIPWPRIIILKLFHKIFSEQKIVLQVGNQAIKMAQEEPWWVANTIKEYIKAKAIDGFLLDSSGGKGIPADLSFYSKCLEQLTGCDVGPGIAGGFTAEMLWKIKPLRCLFPNINIDAEGGLRDNQDQLSIRKASDYIAEACLLFNEKESLRN